MNKTYLIFRHEFFHAIRRISYILLTLSLPVLGMLGIGVVELISNSSDSEDQSIELSSRIGYIDESGIIAGEPDPGFEWFVRYDSRQDALQALLDDEAGMYIVIPEGYESSGRIEGYSLDKMFAAPPDTHGWIKVFLTVNILKGVAPPETITKPLYVDVTRLDESGEPAVE